VSNGINNSNASMKRVRSNVYSNWVKKTMPTYF